MFTQLLAFFQMPIKQELLSFPNRKAAVSRGRPRKAAKEIKESSAENSCIDEVPEVDNLGSPRNRTTRRTLRQQRSPRLAATIPNIRRSSRRKGSPVNYCDASVLHEGESSPEPAFQRRPPERSQTPKKKVDIRVDEQRSTSYREASASPRKPSMIATERPHEDKKLITPKKPVSEPSKNFSPTHCYPDVPSRSVTPSRSSRGCEGEPQHQTPSKRKILSPGMQ